MAPEDSPSALTAIPEFIGVACRFASPSLNAAFSAFRRDAALALRLHQLAWLTALALLWELSVRSIAVSGDDATVRSALVALAVHAYAGPRLQCGRLGAAALAACGTIACSAVVASGGGGGALGFAASLIATLTVLHYAASPLDFRVACALAAVPPLVHLTAPFLDAPRRPHSWLLWCSSVIALLAWSVVHAVLAWTVRVDAAHEFLLAHFAPELHDAVLAAARAGEVFPTPPLEREILAKTQMPPVVFVSGLPRSGTTYLFGLLAEVLPGAAYLDATLCALQGGLLVEEKEDGEGKGRARLGRNRCSSNAAARATQGRAQVDAYFRAVGQKTRLIDRVAASGSTAEEYQHALLVAPGAAAGGRGRNLNDAATLRTFEELCKRVALAAGGGATEGAEGAVRFCLQKNPADASHEEAIHALLPTARFVHISRQPLRVLNSFVQMVLQTAEFESLNPYYALFSPSLLRPSRIVERTLGLRSGFSLYDVGISTVRLVRLVVGRARFTEGVAWLCAHAIRDWSHACDEAHAALPAEIVCHVTFDELMDDPRGTLERLCAFLGANPQVGSLDRIVPSSPRPFKPMPEVLAVAHILKLPPKTK